MTAVLTPAAARRRFVALSALRWLPTGLTVPVLVLLLTGRGHSLATVGALFALHGAVVAALELPTGGLADVWGRRRVLLVAGSLFALALVALALARDLWQLVAAVGLLGAGRALGSGPLEAWYVDTVRLHDPRGDVRGGISRAYAAEAVALAVGAVAGGALPGLVTRLAPELPGPTDAAVVALSVPLLLAGFLVLLYLAGVAVWVVEPPRPVDRGALDVARQVPCTIADGLRLAVVHRTVSVVLLAAALLGVAIAAVEVLAPVQLADALRGRAEGTAAYGVLVTAAFLASGAGSALAPAAARLLRSPALAAAAAFLLAALSVLGLAAGSVVVLAAAGFVVCHLFVAVTAPLTSELLHEHVAADARSTLLSVQSLTGQLGGALGAATLPALAAATSLPLAYALASAALFAAGLALLLARPRPAAPPREEAPPGPLDAAAPVSRTPA